MAQNPFNKYWSANYPSWEQTNPVYINPVSIYKPNLIDKFWNPDEVWYIAEALLNGQIATTKDKDVISRQIIHFQNLGIPASALTWKQFYITATDQIEKYELRLKESVPPLVKNKITFPHDMEFYLEDKYISDLYEYMQEIPMANVEMNKCYSSKDLPYVDVEITTSKSKLHEKYGYEDAPFNNMGAISFGESNPVSPGYNSNLESNIKPVRNNELMRQQLQCPAKCKNLPSSLDSMIQHLNDNHEWSREAIADWIDTLPEQPIYYPDVDSRTDDEKIDQGIKVTKGEPLYKIGKTLNGEIQAIKTGPWIPMGTISEDDIKCVDKPIVDDFLWSPAKSCGCKISKIDNTVKCGKCGNNGHSCYNISKCPNAEPKYYGQSGYNHGDSSK